MAETKEFQAWIKLEASRYSMASSLDRDIKVEEMQEDGTWKRVQ